MKFENLLAQETVEVHPRQARPHTSHTIQREVLIFFLSLIVSPRGTDWAGVNADLSTRDFGAFRKSGEKTAETAHEHT